MSGFLGIGGSSSKTKLLQDLKASEETIKKLMNVVENLQFQLKA